MSEAEFHTDDADASPFPEPVHYARTDNPGWRILNWTTANKLLSYLEPEKKHFAVFSLPDDSYAQCLGSKKALTVEVRVQNGDGTFSHWVFGKGALTGVQTHVGPAGGVRQSRPKPGPHDA